MSVCFPCTLACKKRLIEETRSTYLHAVRIKIPDFANTTLALDLKQAAFQSLELVVDGKESLRDWLRGQHEVVNVAVTSPDQVKKSPLHIKLGRLTLVVKPVAVHSAFVDSVQLSLEIIEVCFSE